MAPQLIVVARHAESEASARGVLNGAAEAGVPLTPRGRDEARVLGAALRAGAPPSPGAAPLVPPDLVVATPFRRTQETAELAAGRPADLLLPGLSDPGFGAWEGRPLAEYRTWALLAPPAEPCPGGGESRVQIALRLAAAWRELAARPEPVLLVVCHSLPLRWLLDGVEGLVPRSRAERVDYARPYAFAAADLERAAALLDGWARGPAPAFRAG